MTRLAAAALAAIMLVLVPASIAPAAKPEPHTSDVRMAAAATPRNVAPGATVTITFTLKVKGKGWQPLAGTQVATELDGAPFLDLITDANGVASVELGAAPGRHTLTGTYRGQGAPLSKEVVFSVAS